MAISRFCFPRGCALLMLCLGLGAITARAEVTNSPPADSAWQKLKHDSETPPEPLRQLPDRMYTEQEIRDYYSRCAGQAAVVADEARQFYTQFPENVHATEARGIYFDMLHGAVALSSTNQIAELENATADRIKAAATEPEKFALAQRLLHSAVTGRQHESDDAMRTELAKRARQLALDFPGHPEGVNYLLGLAENAVLETNTTLARDIGNLSPDPKVKATCQGLIRRVAALGQPLPLKLTLTDGSTLDFGKQHGQVLILLFWNSTNRFSAKALWAVDQLHQKFHAQGLQAVGLNFDAEPANALAMLNDAKIKWPQYLDHAAGGAIQDQFGVRTLPMCWFVDKQGVLRELKGERNPEGIAELLLAEP